MGRPISVKLLALCLVLIALLGVAGVVGLLRESGSQRVQAEAEAAKIVLTLRITSGVLFCFALIEAVLAFGLWRGSRVAWVMSLVVHVFLALLFTYELFDSSSLDRDDYMLAIVPVVIVFLHWVPKVRLWTKQGRVVAVASNT